MDNGNPRCHESMKGNTISVFHGKAFALIRSDGNAGVCAVKAAVAGVGESISRIYFD